MRKKLIAGNWKMNLDITESRELAKTILEKTDKKYFEYTDVLLCPTFVSLNAVEDVIKDSQILLGAQNLSYENNGAYTGEISASMLKVIGCEYAIIGHSERRKYFGENDEIVNKKIIKALEFDLKPILCVGETLEERNSGKQNEVVENQLIKGLKDISDLNNVVIAYEPVWAIGTGQNATPQQANEMHKHIRSVIAKLYNQNNADNIKILYGGSLNDKNCKELLSESDIDGGLIGGASLKADSFIEIIKATQP
ncbi:MAG TPA: triose-phosphate isomerase [Ignavibacteria bacterium]|nr:triose-phosphate isomerase [Ignavibacteria bacterium]